ncbi:MAG: hypothetical protein DMD67_04575 [Gemmatimonadetes bacterium]|nr:MAG: hypothetical protein DMD67_04575 [Gemmatimonadota bacterium]
MTTAISAGDTAWVLASTALVMVMTVGLAFFYGGLVRPKNSLNTMMMSVVALGVISVQWVLVGYSIAFAHGTPLWGGLSWVAFRGVGLDPDPAYAATIPLQAHAMFQAMFAIITPALISGAIVERMRFRAYVVFLVLWATFVYDPLAHWVWGAGGWLQKLGALDFAGGTVVHISAGVSALVAARMLGPRKELQKLGALDFAGGTVVHISAGVSALVAARMLGPRKDFKRIPIVPHNVPLVLLGAGLLWFGWFGFNAGSALAANGLARQGYRSWGRNGSRGRAGGDHAGRGLRDRDGVARDRRAGGAGELHRHSDPREDAARRFARRVLLPRTRRGGWGVADRGVRDEGCQPRRRGWMARG